MLFGTDGIRGIAGDTITEKEAFNLGCALAIFFGAKKVLVAKDNRTSSDYLSYALLSGLCFMGANVCFAGILTTPALSYLAKVGNFDCAVMVTASHNSFEYNGLKVFNKFGEKISKTEEKNIEILMQKGGFKSTSFGKVVFDKKIKAKYLDFLASSFKIDFKEKIVVDCANGASSNFAKWAVKNFKLNTVLINTKSDGSLINKNCGATNIELLSKKVVKHKASFGFAFDGDADRIAIVDEFGKKIDGDALIFAFAKNLLKFKQKIVVTNISNFALEKYLKKQKIEVLRTDVGDRNVYEKLKETSSLFGGEKSGHLIFMPNPCGDGLFNMLKFLEIVSKNKQEFCNDLKNFKPYYQMEKNFKMEQKQLEKLLNDVQFLNLQNLCENELLQNGRLLIRKSGTESCLRVLVECTRAKIANFVMAQIEKFVESYC